MLKLAIVGVGGYGAQHLQGFAMLEQAGLVKIIAIADASIRALEKARQFMPDVHPYGDYNALLDREKLDAVVLATPIPLHEEMALEAVRRGLYVLLEKPAVPLYSQWKTLLRADAMERVAVAFQRISSPGLRLARQMIDQGILGNLQSLSVSAVWPRTGRYYRRAAWAGQLEWKSRPVLDGPATNGLAHYINDIMFLAGDRAGLFAIPRSLRGEVYRARRIPSYDTACLQGCFASGIKFSAGFSHAGTELLSSRLRIEGSNGVVWIEQDGSLQTADFDLAPLVATDGREEMWRDFVDFASGRTARPGVLLRDVEGYTLATNLMFQSAGGIRTVAEPYAHLIDGENGRDIMKIVQLGDLLARAVENHCSLSDVGAPWASPGKLLSVPDFSEEKMLAGLAAVEFSDESETFAAA